jgi:hypothetical protein
MPDAIAVSNPTSSVSADNILDQLEYCITTQELSKALKVARTTIDRWHNIGCPGSDGRLHRLPSFKLGHKRYTHRADLAAFLRALNAAS